MSEDDEGMGVIKRRRSRRMLETRRTADEGDEARISTSAAASAWGDMLGGSNPPQVMPQASYPPKAILRGVPMTSRPPSAAAPPRERSSRPSARPPRITPATPPQSAPPVDEPAPPQAARTEAETPPAVAARQLSPAEIRSGAAASRVTDPFAAAAAAGREPFTTRPGLDPAPEAPRGDQEATTDPAERTLDLTAPSPRPRPWGAIVVGLLLVAAGVWTAVVLLDEMGRTARLDRVGQALSHASQRISAANPGLSSWFDEAGDGPVRIEALRATEGPRLREAVAAAGYAPGVPRVRLIEDSVARQLVLRVDLPDAAVAVTTNGRWLIAPPVTGIVSALAANRASISVSLTLPLIASVVVLVRRRRRRV